MSAVQDSASINANTRQRSSSSRSRKVGDDNSVKRDKKKDDTQSAGEWAPLIIGLIDGMNVAFFIKCMLSRKRMRKTYGFCFLLNVLVAVGSLVVFRGTATILGWIVGGTDAFHIASLLSLTHNILWKLPLFLVSYPLNCVWLFEIFEEAYKENYQKKKADTVSSTYEGFLKKASDALLQGLLTVLVILQTEVLRYLPCFVLFVVTLPFGMGGFGWRLGEYASFPVVLAYEAWMYSFYSFGFRLDEKNLPLFKKIVFFESRWMYFLGYGLPAVSLMAYIASYDTFLASICYFLFLPIHAVLSVDTQPEKQSPKLPVPIFQYANTVLTTVIPTLHVFLSR